MRDSLEKWQPINPMQEHEIFNYAKRLYYQKNKSLIDINELPEGEFKQMVIDFSDKTYGRRNG